MAIIKKYHFVYKITNIINKKYYIGIHSTDNLKDGYFGSGRKLWRYKKRYGKKNLRFEILEFLSNRSSLKEREKRLVNEDLLKDPLCLNLVTGGGGFSDSNEARKYGLLGNKKSQIAQKRLRKENSDWCKRKAERQRKSMIQQYQLGKRSRVINYDWNGKHHTEETKQKMRLSMLGRFEKENNSQFGTCWITNGKENRKVKKENLILNNNWYLGRSL